MHTKDILAAELRAAGLNNMADKAADGYYHDFLSPLATPSLQLADDLTTFANAPSLSEPRRMAVRALLERHMNGEFDSSHEESEAWESSDEAAEIFKRLKAEHRLGDAPIEPEYHAQMNAIAATLDHTFNGDAKGANRKVGFVLMVFEYGDNPSRCNYLSNGADRQDVVTLMKEMIARFEGQPETSGRA